MPNRKESYNIYSIIRFPHCRHINDQVTPNAAIVSRYLNVHPKVDKLQQEEYAQRFDPFIGTSGLEFSFIEAEIKKSNGKSIRRKKVKTAPIFFSF